ncbi:cytosolic purine 5'-nucleotidase-like isoform X2 [Oscarella lobularis]|uniref:cytosolic purine 5'-nucleotidase-like isoform X2 n=1 Tax=Oscarella lobularis TaxID=121494 RepID=UPI00331379B9
METLDETLGHERDFAKGRIFVNRSLNLQRIKFFGFDMDYTLAEYRSPEYEELGTELVVERLLSIGYPQDLKEAKYDPTFPTRGMFFDKVYGNLLKVDQFGNILACYHGFKLYTSTEVRDVYPNKKVQASEPRYFILNTLFNLPETFLMAYLVNYFDTHEDYRELPTRKGVESGNVLISYSSMHQDLRGAVDWVHMRGTMKQITLDNLDKYVVKDSRLPLLLRRMRENERKVFLITNSDYDYTNKLMKHLLDDSATLPPPGTGSDSFAGWKSFFDYIVVDARKPLFFGEGTVLRQIDEATGTPKIGTFKGQIETGSVYTGGNSEQFCDMIGAAGEDVLYVGDHIFGDILKSKKQHGWRTYLVVREVDEDLQVLVDNADIQQKMTALEDELDHLFSGLDSHHTARPNSRPILEKLKRLAFDFDSCFPSKQGSIFRSGSRQTFFAMQAARYADLYASSCTNLINYPFSFFFRAKAQLMPHEYDVSHHANVSSGQMTSTPRALRRSPVAGKETSKRRPSPSTQLRRFQSFVHDEDDEDVYDGEKK